MWGSEQPKSLEECISTSFSFLLLILRCLEVYSKKNSSSLFHCCTFISFFKCFLLALEVIRGRGIGFFKRTHLPWDFHENGAFQLWNMLLLEFLEVVCISFLVQKKQVFKCWKSRSLELSWICLLTHFWRSFDSLIEISKSSGIQYLHGALSSQCV